jgi:hypothetical protein
MRRALFGILLSSIWLSEARATASRQSEFPFEFREGLLWVKVQIPESKKDLNFLLDSGAEASVVNLETARELGLRVGQPAQVRGVGVSMNAFWTTTSSAVADSVTLPNRLLALDLRKLSQSCSCRVDGLIGADFFAGHVVQIDFRESKIRLIDPSTEIIGERSALDVRRSGMRVKAEINGNRSKWFRLDTGCATALQWVTKDVNPKDCPSKVAVGLAEIGIPQTRTTVKIGCEILRNVETGLHNSAIFEGESGLIGNGLLRNFHTVTIDAVRGNLILGPRLFATSN